MYLAEMFRPHGEWPAEPIGTINSNEEMTKFLTTNNVKKLICVRAGLVLKGRIFETGTTLINLHCTRLPDFPGIGTINRALQEKEYRQKATLHVVEKKVDSGQIISELDYCLDPKLSYAHNEDVAYQTGAILLAAYIRSDG